MKVSKALECQMSKGMESSRAGQGHPKPRTPTHIGKMLLQLEDFLRLLLHVLSPQECEQPLHEDTVSSQDLCQ